MKAGVGHRTIALTADDFGMNGAVNAGIAAAFRRGLLTGTSLLVNGPAAEAAAEIWATLERERAAGSLPSAATRRRLADPDRPFDFGLHLNLTQGSPLTDDYPAELRNADGTFCSVWRLAWMTARTGSRHRPAIEREIGAQLARGRELGLSFARVDGHQYVEMLPAVATALGESMRRFGLKHVRTAREPRLTRTTLGEGRIAAWLLALVKRRFAARFARRMREQGFAGTDSFFGTAHAGRITERKVRQFAAAVGAGETAEIGLHPAEQPNADGKQSGDLQSEATDGWSEATDMPSDPWFDPLARRRPQELAMLVSDGLPDELANLGVRLGRVTSAGAPE
jgi:chitin disaccharide deacetylase